MGQTLTNGIYLPNEGERNCYSGLAANWNAVDTLKGNYSLHAINVDIHVTAAEKETWNGKADASALTAHTGDTTIHVTSADKQAWNGKADASALTAHTGNTTIHVTAEDKQTWDAVTSKADDSAVVHKSGNETVGGAKTFTDNNMIKTLSPKVLLINTSQTGNTPPSSNTASFFRFDGGTVNNFGGVQCEFLTTGENRLTNYVKDITAAKLNSIQQRANSTTAMTIFNADLIVPATDNITALGSSSKHWSDVQTYKVNALEPSSLSLPSVNVNDVIDISSYITDFSGTPNTYTAPANGWVTISINNCTGIQAYISGFLGDSRTKQTAGTIKFFMPICKNQTINLQIYGGSIDNARFIPCQGNV